MDGTSDTNGAISLTYMGGTNNASHYCGNSSSTFHVMIGGGDTAPTKNDYDMADTSIIASDKMVSMTQVASATRESGTTVTTQWKNNSSSAIVIKELGLAFKRSSTAYSKAANILFARKVLDTPVTVQPGETYAFSYNIKI